jgi:hypothetical protein
MDKSSVAYLGLGALLVGVGVVLGWHVKPDRVVHVSQPVGVYTVYATRQISPPCDDGREALAMSIIDAQRSGR